MGGVIHSGSMGKIDEGAGREAVTTRRRTPESIRQITKQSRVLSEISGVECAHVSVGRGYWLIG